jgi:hypothetical protein
VGEIALMVSVGHPPQSGVADAGDRVEARLRRPPRIPISARSGDSDAFARIVRLRRVEVPNLIMARLAHEK